MDESSQTTSASAPPSADDAAERVQERFPLTTREMVRQIYLISGAVVVLLSLAIWLLISLS